MCDCLTSTEIPPNRAGTSLLRLPYQHESLLPDFVLLRRCREAI